jgi:pSer/pThr/pTyr-binding forkhead associated (FHA) protein
MWRIAAFDREGRAVASLEVEGGEVTIGREPDRTLVLQGPSVSRRHARLFLDGPDPMIADEGSANGVLINGVRIAVPTPIAEGMRVEVAEFSLVVTPVSSTDSVAARPEGGLLAADSGPLQTIRLVAQGGPFDGQVFDLPGGRVTVGRAVDNDLVFDDPSLSRRHCALRQLGTSRIEVEDLNSSNGTWLNDRRIDRGNAVVGDTIRFGELSFRIEGETDVRGVGSTEAASRRRELLAWGVAGAVALVVAFSVTFLVLRARSSAPGGRDAIAKIAEQAAGHLRVGRERLGDRAFAAAEAEFQQALELDPADVEARRLKALAASEPQNERTAQQIRIRSKLAADRRALEQVVPQLAQLSSESTFREPTAKEVAQRLVSFGQAGCRARHWSDCAWALCKAREVAPPSARSQVVPPAADGALKEAERHLSRERGFVACKLH